MLRQILIRKMLPKYFTQENIDDINKAQTFGELFKIAEDVLSRMPNGEMYQICGPIRTGGLGSWGLNMEVFNKSVQSFIGAELNTFDQVPFELRFKELGDVYDTSVSFSPDYIPCLEEFYRPLYASGRITTLVFIPGWETSRGCNWERERAKEFNMQVVDLPKDWTENFDVSKVKF